jgi:hypothetical protein
MFPVAADQKFHRKGFPCFSLFAAKEEMSLIE